VTQLEKDKKTARDEYVWITKEKRMEMEKQKQFEELLSRSNLPDINNIQSEYCKLQQKYSVVLQERDSFRHYLDNIKTRFNLKDLNVSQKTHFKKLLTENWKLMEEISSLNVQLETWKNLIKDFTNDVSLVKKSEEVYALNINLNRQLNEKTQKIQGLETYNEKLE